MKTLSTVQRKSSGFSLVEVLAAVGIIGIIAFLAIPNIIAIKTDSERNLAISKAEALNMAIASYMQANGRDIATADWATIAGNTDANENARYKKLTPYLSFAPTDFTDYKPNSYGMDLPNDLSNLVKTTLTDPDGNAISY